jgi:hypothetical protein
VEPTDFIDVMSLVRRFSSLALSSLSVSCVTLCSFSLNDDRDSESQVRTGTNTAFLDQYFHRTLLY